MKTIIGVVAFILFFSFHSFSQVIDNGKDFPKSLTIEEIQEILKAKFKDLEDFENKKQLQLEPETSGLKLLLQKQKEGLFTKETYNANNTRNSINKTQLTNGFLLIEVLHQSSDGSSWLDTDKHSYTYDRNNNLLEMHHQFWDGNSWMNTNLHSYQYDRNNNKTQYVYQGWENGMWKGIWKISYTYDVNNNLIEELEQGAEMGWQNKYKHTYSYDENNNRIEWLYENWISTAWENFYKYSYTYDGNNNLIEEFSYSWSGTHWSTEEKATLTYDGNNNKVLVFYQTWSNTFFIWLSYKRETFTYDLNNNLITEVWQNWDDTFSSWKNHLKYSFTYDGNNNQIRYLLQTWSGTEWQNDANHLYTYDGNNNRINELWQWWVAGSWWDINLIHLSYNPATVYRTFGRIDLSKQILDFTRTDDILVVNLLEKSQQSNQLIAVEVIIDTVLHSSDSDLEFTLSHAGITDTIIYQAGGDGDNFIGTILTDLAILQLNDGTAPFTGEFKPHNPLSIFNGVDGNGEWTLSIYDRAAGNTGTLQAWGLKLFYENVTRIKIDYSTTPNDFIVYQNYPNPFNPSTTISWQSPIGSHQSLKVYDVLGNLVATLVDEYKPAGSYEVVFNLPSGRQGLSSGVYFYQLKAGDYLKTKKMILIK